ncbi:hypothetical protein N0V90_010241 [Kalmusia sp. IMI 367209]|nr:hypothetical protein N0V90_010241 [Kalmusia sp. IMI 367209]
MPTNLRHHFNSPPITLTNSVRVDRLPVVWAGLDCAGADVAEENLVPSVPDSSGPEVVPADVGQGLYGVSAGDDLNDVLVPSVLLLLLDAKLDAEADGEGPGTPEFVVDGIPLLGPDGIPEVGTREIPELGPSDSPGLDAFGVGAVPVSDVGTLPDTGNDVIPELGAGGMPESGTDGNIPGYEADNTTEPDMNRDTLGYEADEKTELETVSPLELVTDGLPELGKEGLPDIGGKGTFEFGMGPDIIGKCEADGALGNVTDGTTGPGPIGTPELKMAESSGLEVEGTPGYGTMPEPDVLKFVVIEIDGGTAGAEGVTIGMPEVQIDVVETEGRSVAEGWSGVVVTRHTVVVVKAMATDVTTVTAFVGQSETPEAHSVTVK